MGATCVGVTVRNPTHRPRAWTGAFLVDTGVIDSLVPRRSLEAIGLSPTGRRTYVTADGREVEMDVTVGELEIMGALSGGGHRVRRRRRRTVAGGHGIGVRGHRGRSTESTAEAVARVPRRRTP